MSVSYTEQAVVERRKTVTRRLGWVFLKPGDHLTLCRKVMGRKPGEPLVRLAEVEVVDVQRQRLLDIPARDIPREGVPAETFTSLGHDGTCPSCWATWFARAMGCDIQSDVTRIEWRYL